MDIQWGCSLAVQLLPGEFNFNIHNTVTVLTPFLLSYGNIYSAVITNGMVIPNYSDHATYEKMFATGVSMYGQMTAGSYCYIGPQGIVHGTTITIMNAGRKYLGRNDMAGVVYLSSGKIFIVSMT